MTAKAAFIAVTALLCSAISSEHNSVTYAVIGVSRCERTSPTSMKKRCRKCSDSVFSP